MGFVNGYSDHFVSGKRSFLIFKVVGEDTGILPFLETKGSDFPSTRRHIPEGCNSQALRREKLKTPKKVDSKRVSEASFLNMINELVIFVHCAYSLRSLAEV